MRYFIGFLVAILLLILLIILLVSGNSPKKAVTSFKTLPSYANTDAVASMSIAGPINADSLHASVAVSVSRTQVVFQQMQGYNNTVVRTQKFANNEASYDAFLRALDLAGFTKGNSDKALSNEQGVCSLGQRYVFALNQGNTQLQRFWSTSCGTRTYGGNTSITMTLFQAQVPGYSSLTQNVRLN
jgi:hypothetical protein